MAIARFDDDAIVQASRDRHALFYGGMIWALGIVGPFLAELVRASGPEPIGLIGAGLGLVIFFLIGIVAAVAQFGLAHLAARRWFGAKGSFIGIFRAMLMGSIVNWLVWIPAVGMLVAGLWGVGVLMSVFEAVNGIRRLQAFALASVSGILVQGLLAGLLGPR